MKKTHIFGIIIIAVCVMIIMSTAGDASTYVSFKEAKVMATGGQDKKIHVVGQLSKDEEGNIVGIQPSEDKLSFSFIMVDDNQQEQRVFYNEPMPADFTRSEQVVVIGSYHNDVFVADQILMKCPSKYQEKEIS
ncbi:cytochrome c maturation protein CcmE domain-containing protein [Catalinimonas niigatensis]|uniref:cytochrome c maturation protein CcmE domain-containing protein n=1 Tax=Catalinimonas niigatensis TaxID=1397264 RepID=UPI002665C2DB|nr:cytochrome c maturation protein CcmE [Catalinimonas niigatensis]WPP48408.1 cytochrome c maturation protein CcmE [Catalinimonas niigatensis]